MAGSLFLINVYIESYRQKSVSLPIRYQNAVKKIEIWKVVLTPIP